MTLAFEKPERHSDWVSATHCAAQLVIDALGVTNPASAAGAAISAYPTIKTMAQAFKGVETKTPENLAWKWLSLTLAETVARFLSALRKDTILQGAAVDDAVQAFLSKALNLPPEARFDSNAIESPAIHSAFSLARSQVPYLISAVTLWGDFDTDKWQRVFDDCLAPASFKVFCAYHVEMAPLIENATGSASVALRKDIAWARHYDWINKRFCEDPVFSPDGAVKTPLRDLYMRLRSYWHEEYEGPSEGREEPEKRRKAYLSDLHEAVETWLDAETKDYLRVVAGGPGSGKSSFAKAIACETVQKGNRRVVFIELQRMNLTGDLYRDIGTYLKQRDRPADRHGSAGFFDNPLEWMKTDRRPVLFIFDGLDEITHNAEKATEIARNFVLNVEKLVRDQTQDGAKIHALLLGRNAACQEGMKAAGLPLRAMLNVAPIRPLVEDDLWPVGFSESSEDRFDFSALPSDLIRDQRPEYWDMWSTSQALPQTEPPEAITHEALSDLNVEPLLLHLLILSKFCGEKWPEAAANRNVVYSDILGQIHKRNVTENKPGQKLSKGEYFLFMECLGLAAWRGNLRTGDNSTYLTIRDIHASALKRSGKFDRADMDSMVLQTHARKVDGVEPGFEFIHKSFGEYLTARALMTLAHRTQRQMQREDDPASEATVASNWVELVKDAELTPEIIRFLRDEARQYTDIGKLYAIKAALEELLTWTNTHGMPATHGTFRQMETVQRCAETALLAVASAVSVHLKHLDPDAGTIEIVWGDNAPIHLLHRLRATTGGNARLALALLNLSEAYLSGADLSRADLKGANLSGADLGGVDLALADLRGADLSEAELGRADLFGAELGMANLSGADLRGADLTRADLSGAELGRADLFRANLSEANLSGADLRGADLRGASLIAANLSEADLSRADLREADLSGADFQSTNLDACTFAATSCRLVDFAKANLFSPDAVTSIFGVRQGYGLTKLPDGLEYPEFWHVAEEAETDSPQLLEAYQAAYENWKRTRTTL